MRGKRGHALFHAIVSMGAASVQACGGMTVDSSHTGDGQGAGSAGGDAAGSSSSTGGYGNATSGPFANGGTSSTPTSSSGGSYGYVDAGSAGAVGIGRGLPLDGGLLSMCAHAQQLQCTTWDPTPQGCSCDPNAPLGAADCPSPDLQLYCHSYEPQVGCYCTCVICIH